MPVLRLSVNDIVRHINSLDKNKYYKYINKSTKSVIQIHDVQMPEGPIYINRASVGDLSNPTVQSISVEMMARVANAFVPNHPINIDRVLGASYNTRSALETLLAYTPEFYYCYPGRIDQYLNKVVHGHKHLMWCPDAPHRRGVLSPKDTDIVISEMTFEATYDVLEVPSQTLDAQTPAEIALARQHARIQIALVLIGHQLGYSVWVAQNDRAIKYRDKTVSEMESVLSSLNAGVLISNMPKPVEAARLIDCIWFGNSRYMPAVMEIEHSTGIKSGLTRMQGLQETIPSIQTRYIIVAPDNLRLNAVKFANLPQFRHLNARFFAYSSVEEMYQLCQRRKISGVTYDFIDTFLEKIVD
jgi:type II restriction enzyme